MMSLASQHDEKSNIISSVMLCEVQTSTVSGSAPPEMLDLQAALPTRNGFVHFTKEEAFGGEMKAHGMRPRALSI